MGEGGVGVDIGGDGVVGSSCDMEEERKCLHVLFLLLHRLCMCSFRV